jgi:hypothetical protein
LISFGHQKINPGMVFVLTQPREQVAESDYVMNERSTIKPLLRP